MINAPEVLSSLGCHIVIKKNPLFPNYSKGSDIDVIVGDVDLAVDGVSRLYYSKYSLAYELRITKHPLHTHIDFIENDSIHLRFDIISNFNFLTKIKLSNNFMINIFINRECQNFNGYAIFFPSKIDDLLIRYIEYVEYFEHYSSKIKHLDYILSELTPQEMPHFFKYLHYNIHIQRQQWSKEDDQRPFKTINNKQDCFSALQAISKYILTRLIKKVKTTVFSRNGL